MWAKFTLQETHEMILLQGCSDSLLYNCLVYKPTHIYNCNICLCILETPKQALWLTVKTQMKCSIMMHFIRIFTQHSVTEIHHNLENSTCNPLKYTMGSPIWENQSEYKGLTWAQMHY